jgi:hypothetical protein
VSQGRFRQLFYEAKTADQLEELIEKVREEEGYVFWSFFVTHGWRQLLHGLEI